MFSLCIAYFASAGAAKIVCLRGEPVSADLGEGVIMHTCRWRKAANVTIRTGPIELIKNGILILKAQTNLNGKLDGQFTTWYDDGEIMESGNYVDGLKHGVWLVTDRNGKDETFHYRNGVLVAP